MEGCGRLWKVHLLLGDEGWADGGGARAEEALVRSAAAARGDALREIGGERGGRSGEI